jgi:hypothetical protein
MSSTTLLYTDISRRILDPNNDEVSIGAGSVMLGWINDILDEAAKLTDCLQSSGTVTGTGSAENFVVSGLTNMWRILSVTDKTNGIVYLPIERRDWQGFRNSAKVNSVGGQYGWGLFGYGASRKIDILPIVANNVVITIEHSETHATLTTGQSPSGILNDHDSLVIEGVAAIYYGTTGDTEKYQQAFSNYVDWVQRLGREVGTNPEIKPEMSSLYRFIGEKMTELRGMR